jgi:hypothetical protein
MNYEKLKEKTEKKKIPLSHVGARGGNPPPKKKKKSNSFLFSVFNIYERGIE